MKNKLDGLIGSLAGQGVDRRLERMELDVARSITARVPSAHARSWRFAATAVALASGVGVGASAAALREQPAFADDLTASVRLAPSSLLDTSQ